ncbi:MAG: 3-phosphoshikimate 1-carboxyvinyltransferase, partial [Chloroflexota bacterium]
MSEVIDVVEIRSTTRPIDAVVRLPGSKSYTNRALLVAALAAGPSEIQGALFSDDTAYMVQALRQLGLSLEASPEELRIRVQGADGRVPARAADLFVGNAGTAARFLTAYVALGDGSYRIDGVARMRERPIGPLLDALRQLGIDARSERGNDCPPVSVRGHGIEG